jgi:hypothetical protein
MNMIPRFKKSVSQNEGPELIQKLVQLAYGDVELVNRAIRSSADPSGAADLGKIVDYITEWRRQEVHARAQVAQ